MSSGDISKPNLVYIRREIYDEAQAEIARLNQLIANKNKMYEDVNIHLDELRAKIIILQTEVDDLKAKEILPDISKEVLIAKDFQIAGLKETKKEIMKDWDRTHKSLIYAEAENTDLKERLTEAVEGLQIVKFLKEKVHWVAPIHRDQLRILIDNGMKALMNIERLGRVK